MVTMTGGPDLGGPDASIAVSPDGARRDGALPDGAPPDGMPAPPTAAELLARIASCNPVIGGPFSDSSGLPADRKICGLPDAVFWKADMDIDCDGQPSGECNSMTDPDYQGQTSATDSMGQPLDAGALPYVVVPGISSRFDYSAAGLTFGTVFAVIYDNKLEYGVFGDTGPTAIIGEASYAMAKSLGIDPDPSTGGVADGVSYIAFVGAVADPIEDHDKAVMLGIAHARALLAAH